MGRALIIAQYIMIVGNVAGIELRKDNEPEGQKLADSAT